MGIALAEARRMGLALPGLALAHQLYVAVKAQGLRSQRDSRAGAGVGGTFGHQLERAASCLNERGLNEKGAEKRGRKGRSASRG